MTEHAPGGHGPEHLMYPLAEAAGGHIAPAIVPEHVVVPDHAELHDEHEEDHAEGGHPVVEPSYYIDPESIVTVADSHHRIHPNPERHRLYERLRKGLMIASFGAGIIAWPIGSTSSLSLAVIGGATFLITHLYRKK